jgi:hypothetical protein
MIDGNLTAAASPAASVGGLFHFKPNGQCRLLADFVAKVFLHR